MSCFVVFSSICRLCLKEPSSSCIQTIRGPMYLRTPVDPVSSCLISSSTVFLFRLKTNVPVNFACPPWLTHCSTKAEMSFPVTVKMALE